LSTTPTKSPEVPRLLKTHGDLFDKHFFLDLDEQSAVLKAHQLIEMVVRDFCYGSVRHPDQLRNLKLSFNQIVGVARSFMFLATPGIEHYWGMVLQLNQLRNLMAHELEPDQKKIDKHRSALISVSGQHTLNESLSWLCGAMSSLLYVSLELHKYSLRPNDGATPSEDSTSQ